MDPATGTVQGRREWGETSLSRENLLPFLYRLHYSLHGPVSGEVDFGALFMGIVAIVWVLDSFVGLWLAFPKPSAWRASLAFRVREGGYRLLFDVHRSGGVWTFGLLLVLAATAVSMNLGTQVVRPLVSWFSPLTQSPFDDPAPKQAVEPRLSRGEALEKARKAARQRGIGGLPGAIFCSPEFGLYGVGFFEPGNDHGDGGLGNPWLNVSAVDGRLLSAQVPGQGTAGDVFMQAQFPLHSGRILGTWGRVLVSFMGLVVAALSATGVVIWARKLRARRRATRLRGASAWDLEAATQGTP